MSLEQSNPLVTVYIPTFNRVELLKRAVESVRQQTYQNLEIIVVDDCSIDGTHEYLKEISNRDSRIRFFLKEKNSGACSSRNIAIKHATGEFITGLDDDDYFLDFRIKEFVDNSYLIRNDCVGLCSFYSLHKLSGVKTTFKILKSFEIERDNLFVNNDIGNQIFTRTSFLISKSGFNENLSCLQDLDCWINLLNYGVVFRLNNFSYVVDTTHEKIRITDNRIDKYVKSVEIISSNHNLNERQKKIFVKSSLK